MAKIQKKPIEKQEKLSLSSMTEGELAAMVKQLISNITKKKMDMKVGRLKNVREVFSLRKQLARVNTVINVKKRINSVKS
jgi:ribosomal protein L29